MSRLNQRVKVIAIVILIINSLWVVHSCEVVDTQSGKEHNFLSSMGTRKEIKNTDGRDSIGYVIISCTASTKVVETSILVFSSECGEGIARDGGDKVALPLFGDSSDLADFEGKSTRVPSSLTPQALNMTRGKMR